MTVSRSVLMGSGSADPDLFISPDFDSKSEWSFADDGALNIGTTGAYIITPVQDITADIEMWGGGGGTGWDYSSSTSTSTYPGPGGGGGYAAGRLVLRSGVEYVLHIGEGGLIYTGTSGSGTRTNADYRAGGIAGNWGPQAGGYSGIFKTTTISQATAYLIAGGGGAGGDSRYDGTGAGAGGGQNGQHSGGAGLQGGYGGHQNQGGAASGYAGTPGAALLGGTGGPVPYISSGGGGGYYGGGGGNGGGGGGGSGYYKSSDFDLTNVTRTVGNYDTPGNPSGSNRGGSGKGGSAGAEPGNDGRIIIEIT